MVLLDYKVLSCVGDFLSGGYDKSVEKDEKVMDEITRLGIPIIAHKVEIRKRTDKRGEGKLGLKIS